MFRIYTLQKRSPSSYIGRCSRWSICRAIKPNTQTFVIPPKFSLRIFYPLVRVYILHKFPSRTPSVFEEILALQKPKTTRVSYVFYYVVIEILRSIFVFFIISWKPAQTYRNFKSTYESSRKIFVCSNVRLLFNIVFFLIDTILFMMMYFIDSLLYRCLWKPLLSCLMKTDAFHAKLYIQKGEKTRHNVDLMMNRCLEALLFSSLNAAVFCIISSVYQAL